jgi:TrmH family RNA methyltransferase
MHSPLLLTSRANPRFKVLRAQAAAGGARRTHTLLLGEKLIEAWAETRRSPAGARLRPAIWLRLDGARAHPLEKELGCELILVGESLMRDLAEAGSPPSHALFMELGPESERPLPERVIAPWGIQDPGNLGAVLRSAAAFGFQEALLGPGCADPFSPKALRGSMGAAFLTPLRRCIAPPLDEGRWYALHGGPGSIPLEEADLRSPVRILVGNEGHGWRETELPPAVRFLAIPTQGVESLNAAVAAGIACYEAARRREP